MKTHITLYPKIRQLFSAVRLCLLLLPLGSYAQLTLNTPTNNGIFNAPHSIVLESGFESSPIGMQSLVLSAGANDYKVLGTTPSNDQNYIITYKPRVAGIANPANPAYQNNKVMVNIQYLDGLGRPTQNIQVKGSPDGNDIIQPIVYDPYGREAVQYLPYTLAPTTANNGSYQANAIADQAAFYAPSGSTGTQLPNGIARITTPYSVTGFEPSPLNRPVEQGAPGDIWQPAAGHTKKTNYFVSSSDEIPLLTATPVTIAGQEYKRVITNNGLYEIGGLYLTVTKDENGTSTDGEGAIYEYKDKQGRTILKTVDIYDHTVTPVTWNTLSTYYIYDYKGNLSFIIPPNVDISGFSRMDDTEINNALTVIQASNSCYEYRYDGRNRLIEKRIPGKDWEYMVYNQADQLCMSQDAVQRANGKWLFTKYDAMNREVLTGICSSTADRPTQQSNIDGQINYAEHADNTTSTGYSNLAYPVTGIDHYLSINYFDDYTFPGASNLLPANTNINNTISLLTGTRTYTTDGASSYLSALYYDQEGQLIENVKQNALGGTDRTLNTYNFLGQLTGNVFTHVVGSQTTTIANSYEYDQMGRKYQTRESINGAPEIILSELHYNEIGQLITKNLHSANNGANFLSTIDYTYNERGWLKSQNNPLFNMTLKYEDGPTPQYNGNISQQLWGTHNYTYTYDKLNRLSQGISDEAFNEKVTYDLMGNILTLNRNTADLNTYTYNGNQLSGISGTLNGGYTYDANGNMITDGVKGVTIAYNYLNLPEVITKSTDQIVNIWLADGTRIKKVAGGITRQYDDGIEYNNGSIDFIQTEEGRAINSGNGNYNYEYMLRDNLGNTRVLLSQDGTIKETADYYPFGMQVSRAGQTVPSPENRYKYNGKELQTELGLNQYDYGARYYDPAIARWTTVDPLAEDYDNVSPYNYALNNPINNTDPDGRGVDANVLLDPFNANYSAAEANNNIGGDDDDKKNINKDDEKPKPEPKPLKEVTITGWRWPTWTFNIPILGEGAQSGNELMKGNYFSSLMHFGTALAEMFTAGAITEEKLGVKAATQAVEKKVAEKSVVMANKSVTELRAMVGGKNAALLRELFGRNEQGAKAVLDNIENIKIPPGLTKETMEAYRELINRVGDPRGTQAIRAEILDHFLK